MRMLKKINLVLVSFLLTMSYGFSQTGLGTLKGTVKDSETEEPVYAAKIAIFQNGNIKGQAKTDFDGKFQINSISPGSYDVEIRNQGEGYVSQKMTGVIISSGKITFLDNISLSKTSDVQELEEVTVIAYKVPLINKDGGSSGATITQEDISKLPVRSATGVAQTVGGVSSDEGSGGLSVRGSRSNATYYYIDGIKVRGSANLPKSALQEVSVITGGLPANYGDATGGIISVTTRGPSAKYFGSVEAVTSGFYFKGKDPVGYDGKVIGLDKYGYNLVEGMLSGPLWMRKDSTGKKTKPVLGFLVSANFTDQIDSRPFANGGGWRIKKEARDYILANPLRPTGTGTGTYYNTDFLSASDFEQVPWRMNARRSNVSAQAKIDVNTGPSVNLSFGGSMNYAWGKSYSYPGSLLNFENFGNSKSLDWRVFGRLTQRFAGKEGSKVKSAFYSLMVDYSKSTRKSFDDKHGFDIFSYGHVGTFVTQRSPSYQFVGDNHGGRYVHNGFRDERVDFTPSNSNPTLAAITSQYYTIYDNPVGHYENLFQIQQGNALRNGDSPQSVYGIWSNIGSPFNYFGKTDNDQFRVSGSGSVNIGDHSISLGFEYEQRWDRGFTSGTTPGGGGNGPVGIWGTARQLANFHITELDTSQAYVDYDGSFQRITYNRLNSGYAYTSGTGNYGGALHNDNQSFFDYNFRKYLTEQGIIGGGVAGTDFIDVDRYDPSIYKLSWFSPDELLNSGNSYVSYWGFDHTGKKVKGRTDINKYFNEYDENGNYKRFVGAFQPIYFAGYVMDKFAFRDIVFNVGVRVDVFDANQPVLKDKYLLFNAKTVAEARQELANNPSKDWINLPSSMGDDYVVYVDNVENPNAINGFRNGDTWYNAEGVVVEDPSVIRGATGISPWLVDPTNKTIGASAFEDYKAKVNVMPRIAFSFPVSDEASFSAHYDILTTRPNSGFRFDPFQYQFIRERSATVNNSNLKPEKTVDYEIGFQQVLTKTSSLKISAFYRELRDQVQMMNVFEAYPATYKTFGNRDFGTVKGITVAYDLRRTGNIRMTANYTLQFADGTGSDASSSAALVNAGLPNLRTIFPFSYDRRHNFAVTFDYRYGTGKDYNGPMIKDFEVFGNMGLNLMTNVYSGSPYTATATFANTAQFSPIYQGTLGTRNGSRLPWSYRLDLQIDRSFNLTLGKEDKKRAASLNVYLRVTNLLNQMNILGVYRATGNPLDDGYLAAASSQASIQSQNDAQSFRDYYLMKVQNPYNISSPRTIRLGIKFDF